MRFHIGESAADINVLLTTLRGTHAPVRSSVITSTVVALIVLGVVPSLVGQTIDTSQVNERAFGVAMVLFMIVFPFWMVLHSLASYEINAEGITKTSPFELLSWRIPRGEIHQIALEMNHGWTLVLTTTSSKTRAMPLEGSLRQSLEALYPEVAPFQPTSRDIRRWKMLGILLSIVVLVIAVMLWWLARQGLVS
jgi:hypothetical protein